MVTPHDLIVRISLVSCVLVGFLASGSPSLAQVLPPIITPSPGSTLTTTTITFTGGHASKPGEEHWLSVGFGTRIWDNLIYHQSLGTGHTAQVSGLPTSGTLHVLYWTMTDEAEWAFREHTYTMNVGSGGNPQDDLAVFDDNGKRVGPVVGLESDSGTVGNNSIEWVLVPLMIDDLTVIGRIKNQQFLGNSNVFFSSTDCTGQPLMLTQQESSVGPFEETFAIVGEGNGSGNIVWRPDPSAVPFAAGTSVQSTIRKTNKECTTAPGFLPSPGTMIVNAIQVIDLDNIFTAPFKLQQDLVQ